MNLYLQTGTRVRHVTLPVSSERWGHLQVQRMCSKSVPGSGHIYTCYHKLCSPVSRTIAYWAKTSHTYVAISWLKLTHWHIDNLSVGVFGMTFGRTKDKEFKWHHNRNIKWAKTELFVHRWQRPHAVLDAMCLPTFFRASASFQVFYWYVNWFPYKDYLPLSVWAFIHIHTKYNS